jgi:hypothetical protein
MNRHHRHAADASWKSTLGGLRHAAGSFSGPDNGHTDSEWSIESRAVLEAVSSPAHAPAMPPAQAPAKRAAVTRTQMSARLRRRILALWMDVCDRAVACGPGQRLVAAIRQRSGRCFRVAVCSLLILGGGGGEVGGGCGDCDIGQGGGSDGDGGSGGGVGGKSSSNCIIWRNLRPLALRVLSSATAEAVAAAAWP